MCPFSRVSLLLMLTSYLQPLSWRFFILPFYKYGADTDIILLIQASVLTAGTASISEDTNGLWNLVVCAVIYVQLSKKQFPYRKY